MNDSTEQVRRQLVSDINSQEMTRGELEQKYVYVWDTEELQRGFIVSSFMAPFVVVTRKADGKQGVLQFQHLPRFYFDFQES